MERNVFDLKAMQKKGAGKTASQIEYLIGALILVVIAVALAPTMFASANNLSNTTANPGVPSWVPTILIIVIGAGLVFLVYEAFGHKR